MRAETTHAVILLAIVAGLGFALFAAYETVFPAAEGFCSVSPFFSCAAVDQSSHTTTLGVQDWAWGIAGFALLLALDVPLYRTWKRSWLVALTLASLAGALFSVYLAYVELGIIGALCPVCLGAYLCNAVVLGFALVLVRKARGSKDRAPPTDAEAS
ncbi:MAG TPA: vitamin K epoxide reductase family protein [Thermoplasmata archaeon]